MKAIHHPNPGRAGCNHFSRLLSRMVVMIVAILSLHSGVLHAQEDEYYDEIALTFLVQRVGSIEVTGVIRNEQAYLPLTEVFDFLKIRNILSTGMDSVSGTFIDPGSSYLVDYPGNRILLNSVETRLTPDALIKTETNLYLHSRYFGQVFGLNCAFNYRSLGVIMETKLELPVIREMRLEQMRNSINKLSGVVSADTVLPRSYPMFHVGMADWSVISNQMNDGKNDTRVNLALGTVIAGGEANVSLLYNSNRPFDEKQQQYLWRFANNDFTYVRQVMVGKIASQATSSIYAPVVGIQATNSPTSFRKSFGSYTLSDRTEPGWTVELYVNNVLIDYTKADASGFFTFEVPLVYGNSSVVLKYYGPWGEERSKEQNISIPFNFLPQGEIQYTASAGIVEDDESSRYARANVNYGLSKRITIGGGTEYLSSVKSGTVMPFLSGSVRLISSLLLTGDYTYGVRSRGTLTYRLPSNLQFELYYAQYDRKQKAINYNYLEERKAVISIPIKTRSFSAFSRLTYNQIILPESRYSTSELLLSGAILGVSTNLTTYAMFIDNSRPYTYSNLSLSFRLPASFVLIPQAQYEYNNSKLISLKCGLEKHIFRHGFANVSYERNFRSDLQNIEFGFRFDFSFAQTAFTTRRVNKNLQFTTSAKGSLIADRKSDYLHAGNRNMVGRGGVVIVPFLDMNCNGHQESFEPKAYGLKFQTNGGRVEINLKDTTYRIFDLEPYSSQYITFDKNSFDNIAWQIRHQVVNITIDPNQFRRIEVPIAVLGEASGMVYLKSKKGLKGQGRILINFYTTSGKLAGRTMSEPDGYFSFLGLPPGMYSATIDSAQMRKINMVSSPAIEFEILMSQDGDVFGDLEFNLTSMLPEKEVKTERAERNEKPVETVKAATPVVIQPQVSTIKEKSEPIPERPLPGSYGIQVGSFSVLKNAESVRDRLVDALMKEVFVQETNGMYRVVVTGFETRLQADTFLPKVKSRGFTDAYVIRLK